MFRGRFPDCVDRIANLDREIEFGAGEALRLYSNTHSRVAIAQRMLAHHFGAAHRDVDNAGPVQAKHHAALGHRGRVTHTCMTARRAPFRDS